jgi:hypothetical protein
MPSYTVITTYGDGRKTSDYGAESAVSNGIIKLILFVIGVAVGTVLTFIYLIILGIRYFYLYTKASPKPSFTRSAFIFYLIFILSLPVGFSLGFLQDPLRNLGHAQTVSRNRVYYDAAINAYEHNLPVYIGPPPGRNTTVVMGLDGGGVRRFNGGEVVRIIGMPFSRRGGGIWDFDLTVPVEYGGERGSISLDRLRFDP